MLPITLTVPNVIHKTATRRSENQLPGSKIEEARNLVKRCAEPRPVGDSAKAAINRAAERLGFSDTRTKDIWYGNAARIDASEMDVLRAGAALAEIDQGIAGLEILRERLSTIPSAVARQAVDGIDAVLGILGGCNQFSDVEG